MEYHYQVPGDYHTTYYPITYTYYHAKNIYVFYGSFYTTPMVYLWNLFYSMPMASSGFSSILYNQSLRVGILSTTHIEDQSEEYAERHKHHLELTCWSAINRNILHINGVSVKNCG